MKEELRRTSCALLAVGLALSIFLPLIPIQTASATEQVGEPDTQNQITVTWFLERDGIIERTYLVSIQNLKSTGPALRQMSASVIIDNLNYSVENLGDIDVELWYYAVENVYTPDWENVFYENRTALYENGDNDNQLTGYDNAWIWEVTGSHYEEKSIAQWTLLTPESMQQFPYKREDDWGDLLLPKAGTATTYDDYGDVIIEDATLWFRITFNNRISTDENDAYNTSGRIALDLDGFEYHPWWNASWNYKRQITISDNFVDNENFTNYPMLIEITLSDANTLDNGQDIAFVNSAENVQLDHEIESFDTENLVAWVEIPTLYDNENTIIYVYYGNASAGVQESPNDVWDDNHLIVYHMVDGDNNSSIAESTSNNPDGVKGGANTPEAVAGQIGNGQDFANEEFTQTADFYFTSEITLSAWVNVDKDAGDAYHSIIGKPHASGAPYTEYGLRFDESTDKIGLRLIIDGTRRDLTADTTIDTNWHYVVGSWDNATMKIFIDGEEQPTVLSFGGTLPNYATDIYLGINSEAGADQDFAGQLDEVRISDISRSANFIYTTWLIQDNATGAITLGAEESSGVVSDKPENLAPQAVVLSATTVNLYAQGWDNDNDGFTLYFHDNSDGSLIDSVNATNGDNATVAWTGLTPGTTYGFTVWAENGASVSDNSDLAQFVINVVPSVPENLYPSGVIAENTTVDIYAQGRDNDANAMTVFFHDNSDGSLIGSVAANNGDNATVAWSGLTAGTTYSFNVWADDNNGDVSDNATAVTFTINSAPDVDNIEVNFDLVDRKMDFENSGARENIIIRATTIDNDNRDGMSNAYIFIRDSSNVIVIDNVAMTEFENIDENTKKWNYAYNPDNALDNLGRFDVKVIVADNFGDENIEDYTDQGENLFIVDDLDMTLAVSDNTPFTLDNINISGTATRKSGENLSLENAVRIDNVHGTNLDIRGTYYIYTLNDLQGMENNLDETCILMDNIDASATTGWNNGTGFDPIGKSANIFTGTFDGQGFTISNLFIDNENMTDVGLFGFASGATISNVILKDVDITANTYVGALVGVAPIAAITVTNVGASGTVESKDDFAGGLFGYFLGTLSTSYSTVNVTAGADYGGGLTGYQSTGTVTNSYATGTVTGTGINIGGFAGLGDGVVGSITNSYSTGAVSGAAPTGGFIGDGNVADSTSFWDTETSGQATSPGTGSGGEVGKTTAEMKTQSTFTDEGWDFENVWVIDAGINDGYPRLQYFDELASPSALYLETYTISSVKGTTFSVYVWALENAIIDGVSATENLEVVNISPVPVITAPDSGTTVSATDSLIFTSTSTDRDNDTLTYLWEFGDGQTETTENTTHAFANAGDYATTFTADDGTDNNSTVIILHATSGVGSTGGGGGGSGQSFRSLDLSIMSADGDVIDATVRLIENESGRLIDEGTTNQFGNVTLRFPGVGEYTLEIEKEGFAPYSQGLSLVLGTTKFVTLAASRDVEIPRVLIDQGQFALIVAIVAIVGIPSTVLVVAKKKKWTTVI